MSFHFIKTMDCNKQQKRSPSKKKKSQKLPSAVDHLDGALTVGAIGILTSHPPPPPLPRWPDSREAHIFLSLQSALQKHSSLRHMWHFLALRGKVTL